MKEKSNFQPILRQFGKL